MNLRQRLFNGAWIQKSRDLCSVLFWSKCRNLSGSLTINVNTSTSHTDNHIETSLKLFSVVVVEKPKNDEIDTINEKIQIQPYEGETALEQQG